MNFLAGILTAIVALAALVEWRTGIISDMLWFNVWEPFTRASKKRKTRFTKYIRKKLKSKWNRKP